MSTENSYKVLQGKYKTRAIFRMSDSVDRYLSESFSVGLSANAPEGSELQ
jgi:hypothetical protein